MSKILWLECESGISGDMSVAALTDLGADTDVLQRALDSLKLEGLKALISRVNKSGLDCADFNVITGSDHDGLDHDMEYLYGHTHSGNEENHGHDHDEHGHGHDHDEHCYGHHDHGHDHDGHGHHGHRNLAQVREIISGADITPGARRLAFRIFDILAQAEAQAHGVGADEVHFHEVGAVDSIADIVGFAVCYDNLGIERTVITEIAEGEGTIRCQHGILPVPVPAVVNIAREHRLPLKNAGIRGELVTPTGAAIAAAVRTDGRLPESYIIKKTGLGAGKRSYELPGFVRAMLIEEAGKTAEAEMTCADGGFSEPGGKYVYRLESDIDDCGGEAMGFTQELLYKAGAREVHYTPVFMKKNRPAYELTIICDETLIKTMEDIIFRNTTTIGIRRVKMERTVLERELVKVETSLGEAQVKMCFVSGDRLFYPEYESVAAISREKGIPYMEVYELIRRECPEKI